MRKFLDRLRAVFFFLILLGMMSLCVIDLMKIQIVDGAEYLEKTLTTRMATQGFSSSRGEIVGGDGYE
ncbi:MAG: hypothetical protein K2K44_08890, partial [Oscillospiraceae bacterium]|nr:hypothetical protein [Oscillospiraceae bacterium]